MFCKANSAVLMFVMFVFSSTSAADPAGKVAWPPLPKKGFITGKPATKADVEARRAVFAYIHKSVKAVPIKMTLPQYGILNVPKTSISIRVIVLQGEKINGRSWLGYIDIKTGKRAVALIENIRLLGQNIKKSKSRK